MQLSQEIITASASAIRDTGDHLFWASTPDDSLAMSIEEFGQTTPILAQETEDGLELIAGHARLAIARSKNLPVMVRLVVDANDVEKGLLYIVDNSQRPLDDGMRLAAVKYFSAHMDEKAVTADILPRLGIKPQSKDAKLIKTWLSLDETWQGHLASGHVPLAAGATLARMDEADRVAIEPLFANFSWSRSNAVNMLTWLFETAKMTASTADAVMTESGLADILRQGLTPKDAIAKLTMTAKAARYPELTQLQDTFTKSAKEITAGTKWRMNQPNNFETGGSELTIQVKDADQLAAAIKDLESMATLSPWQTIWNLGGKND